MKMSRAWLIAALLAAGATRPAAALPLTSDLLTNFNAIVTNFSSQSDTVGAVMIGGNLSGPSTTFDTQGYQPTASSLSGYGGVNIYGNASGGPYNVNNLTVHVGGSQNATFSGASKVTSNYAFPYSYSSIAGQLTQVSSALSKMATTGSSGLAIISQNSSIFTAQPVNGVAVINITAAQLEQVSNPAFNLNGAKLLVVNVDGNFSTGSGNFNDSNYASDILWNFYDATSLNFGVEFGGTVLAPNATVSSSSPIDGTLFAASFQGNGELHFKTLTDASYLNSVGSVPEASTWTMLLLGFAGLGLASCRRIKSERRCGVDAKAQFG